MDLVETEQHRTASLERELQTLKQVKDAGTSAESRATSLEHHSHDLQSKLQLAQAAQKVQQAELVDARKELQRLAISLDEEQGVNKSLCDQVKVLKEDLRVCSVHHLCSVLLHMYNRWASC